MEKKEHITILWCGTGCAYAEKRTRLGFNNDGGDYMYFCKKVKRLLAFENLLKDVGCGSFTRDIPDDACASCAPCDTCEKQDESIEIQAAQPSVVTVTLPVVVVPETKKIEEKRVEEAIVQQPQTVHQTVAATSQVTERLTAIQPSATEPILPAATPVVEQPVKKKRGRPAKKKAEEPAPEVPVETKASDEEYL